MNFRLTRDVGYAITESALHTIAVDTRNPARTQPIATLPLESRARALTIRTDPAHARGTHAYVALDDGALAIVDLRNPAMPRLLRRTDAELLDPRRMLAQGDYLWVADGTGGVAVFDVQKPLDPTRVALIATAEARDITLAWPWLVVADGTAGLRVVDVADPRKPRVVSTVDLNGGDAVANEATDVEVLFQYSRTFALDEDGARIDRTPARLLAFVACGLDGVRIVDLTRPDAPVILHGATARRTFRFNRGDVRGVAVNTVFDIGTSGGGVKSEEHDYLYVYVDEGDDGNRQQRVRVFDVSDPVRPKAVRDSSPRVYGGTGELLTFRAYNEPFLQHFVLASGAGGLGTLIDVSRAPTTGAQVAATWDDLRDVRDLHLEEFPLDRLQDERGNWIKDISHEGCRYLTPEEMLRVLNAEVPVPGYRTDPYGFAIDEPRPRRNPR